MIKKHQRWIALLVALAFVWLLEVSAMPLAASGSNEQIGSADGGQGPDFHEVAGHKAAPPQKKSLLPYVLIGVGVVAVAAVLFLVVLKTSYDIVGTWTVHVSYDGNYADWDTLVVLSGGKKSGSAIEINGGSGTYAVDGKDITVILLWPSDEIITCTGKIESNDRMSGRFVESVYWQGDWTAVRVASGAALPGLKKTVSAAAANK